MKFGFAQPNWDTDLIDYDEIYLNMLYSTVLIWLDNSEYTEQLILMLNETLIKAELHDSYNDVILIREQFWELYKIQHEIDKAEYHLTKAIEVMDLRDVIKYDAFNYGVFHTYLIEIYLDKGMYESIPRIIQKLEQKLSLNTGVQIKFAYYKAKITMKYINNEITDAFELSQQFVDESINNFEDFAGISPHFVVKEIYQLILVGLELERINNKSEIEKYNQFLDPLISNFLHYIFTNSDCSRQFNIRSLPHTVLYIFICIYIYRWAVKQ